MKYTIHKSWLQFFTEYQMVKNLMHLYEITQDGLHNAYNPTDAQDIYKVFETDISKIKVVILGEEPHPNPKYATGLAYTMPNQEWIPSADIQIMYRELIRSLGSFNQEKWVEQGVFLLNASLTVERGKPGSHRHIWRDFIGNIISQISHENPCIWFLWGDYAKSFRPYINYKIDTSQYNRDTISRIPIGKGGNVVFQAEHPTSELTNKKGFLGCDHFYMANKILTKQRIQNITW